MPTVPSTDELRSVGRRQGLDAVEVTSAEPFEAVRATLEQRKAAGLHGGMAFTYRDPSRSTDPSRAVDGARSLVVGARNYDADQPPRPSDPVGRIARYAWSDHYGALAGGLGAVADLLRAGGWRARVVVDDNALVDRAAAHRAGIGWWGKNANLLLPGRGSWFVLGSVITDAPLTPSQVEAVDRCGSCTRCFDGCPTGAIVAAGVVDARRCLSWLLQAEGAFPPEHRVALGDRIYGCDDCQEVCPPNRRSMVRPTNDPEARAWASLLALLDVDDAVVLAEAGRWYIPRREVRYLRRNALVVLGNVGDPQDPRVPPVLARHLRHEDPMLRSHAVWAARRLALDHLVGELRDDPDPDVQRELAMAVAPR